MKIYLILLNLLIVALNICAMEEHLAPLVSSSIQKETIVVNSTLVDELKSENNKESSVREILEVDYQCRKKELLDKLDYFLIKLELYPNPFVYEHENPFLKEHDVIRELCVYVNSTIMHSYITQLTKVEWKCFEDIKTWYGIKEGASNIDKNYTYSIVKNVMNIEQQLSIRASVFENEILHLLISCIKERFSLTDDFLKYYTFRPLNTSSREENVFNLFFNQIYKESIPPAPYFVIATRFLAQIQIYEEVRLEAMKNFG